MRKSGFHSGIAISEENCYTKVLIKKLISERDL